MALRDAAVRKGLHVSEYGVLDDATGETHRCATEAEVYALLGMAVHRARAAREPRRARGGCDAERSPSWSRSATCAATCTATPPPRTGRRRSRRWRWPPATPATSTSRSPTTRRASGFGDDVSPTGCASRSSGSARTDGRRGSSCWPAPRSTSSPTARSTTTTSCSPSSTGWSQRPLVVPDGAEAMTERIVRAIEHPLVDASATCRAARSSAGRRTQFDFER